MMLSRTARILLAIMLLAAAGFFWVNFFTQNRVLDDPLAPTTAVGPAAPVPRPAPAGEAAAVPTPGEPAAAVDPAEASDGTAPDAELADAVVVGREPEDDAADPLVVIDPPITLARDVVVAELPFLVTEPPPPPEPVDPTSVDPLEAERALAAARATVNPFSPIMVRRAPDPAPVRDVPPVPEVVEVAVPAGPPAPAPEPVRLSAPAPRPLAPTPTASRDMPRALPTGTPLAATPGLLQETRAIDTIDRIAVPEIVVTRLPEDEPAAAQGEAPRMGSEIAADVPELRGPEETAVAAEVVEEPVLAPDAAVVAAVPSAGQAPLVAGTNRLTRYLRDKGYSFTGSVLGPVSVGVFRSNDDPSPQVVALGQTLPNTDIVLTDLRGQQAELTLDDLTQILILDIRR